jgi:acyl-CoA thioesterase
MQNNSWWEIESEKGPDQFPGLDMRKPDMNAYNQTRTTLDRRQLQFYRLLGSLPPAKEKSILHAAAHLYASDRNGLFAIPNFLDNGDEYSAMASLNHTVIFHTEAEGLSMVDEANDTKWFCLEESIDHISHGRALAIFKIWDVKSGRPVATAMQDGLIRMEPGVQQCINGMFSIGIFQSAKGEKGKL